MSRGFKFKQFFVEHSQCAMKVNTDGILLGAIADLHGVKTIVDLGTGTGLVAMMLAQRSPQSEIVAVEIEPNAYQQAVRNIENFAYRECVKILHSDVMDLHLPASIDLVVSNPPYFPHSLLSRTAERDLARAASQSHFSWLEKAKSWLSENGRITLILPTEQAQQLISQAEQISLYAVEQWRIVTKKGKQPKRIVVTFAQQKQPCVEKSLEIYQEDNQYSPEFKALTRDFYLHF